MTEHLTEENIEHYRRREIDPAIRREADAHLAMCDACLDRVLAHEHSAVAFTSLNEALLPSETEGPFHLSPVELRSYVEGSPSDAERIIFTSHLDDCPKCSQDLAALNETIRSESESPVRGPEILPTRSGWLGLSWLTPATVTVAVVIVSLIAFGLVQWRRQQSANDVVRSDPPTNQTNSSPLSPTPEPSPAASLSAPSALLVLKDNTREIRLEQDGRLVGLDGIGEEAERSIASVMHGGEITKPKQLEDLSAPNIKLLGPPDANSFHVISPLGKVVVEDRPTLRWETLRGADSYMVSIFDENFNGVALSPSLSRPQWTSNVALKRGKTYTWEVKAKRDEKEIAAPAAPAPPAKFRIVETDHFNSIRRAQQQNPVSHLALGLAYARAGLVVEAEREFRQLVNENPDSPLAKKLLRTVQEWK